MSSKPIHLRAAGPKGDRQAMWEALRALHQAELPISVSEVRGQLSGGVPQGRVRDYLTALEAGGYLVRCPGITRIVRYTLARDVGVDAPRVRKDGSEPTQGRGREALWRTLRIIGECTAAELAGAASTPAVEVAEATAAEYLQFLHRGGYLERTRQGSPGTPDRYRLIGSRWTGPRAPMIQKLKQLYDPNTGEVVYRRAPVEGDQP